VNRFTPRTELDPAPIAEWERAEHLAQRLKKTDLLNSRPTRRLAERAEKNLQRRVYAAVGERYAESNRRTEELTGLDLAGYGWPV
jgi:hypothetical protein